MSFLSPYRWLLIGGLIAALWGWHWNDKRGAVNDAVAVVQAKQVSAALVASEKARSREKQLQTTVQEAKNAAVTREKTLLADAGRSRLAADRMRHDLNTIRASLPGLTRAAVERYADTASVVFDQCVNEYRSMAAEANRLASDRQTLIEAWPR